jgi:hypothetical protein
MVHSYCNVCNCLPGLKRAALPGGIAASAPVRGLRPMPVLRLGGQRTPEFPIRTRDYTDQEALRRGLFRPTVGSTRLVTG